MANPIRAKFKEIIDTREPVRQFVQCILVSVGGSVSVPGRAGYCWASEFNQPQSIFQVLNKKTPHREGLAVKVGYPEKPPFERQVVGEWDQQLFMTGYSAPSPAMWDIGEHAVNHQYISEDDVGDDPVLVFQPALQPLKVVPKSGLTVLVKRGTYWSNSTFRRYPGANVDLTSYVPTSGTKHVMIYLDESGAAQVADGTAVASGAAYVPEPARPDSSFPLAYVQLTTGDTTISATSIEDIRGINMANPSGVSTPTAVGQIDIAVAEDRSEYRLPVTSRGGIVVSSKGIVYT